MGLAWKEYADDFNDRVVRNPDWVPGRLSWGTERDNTNVLNLTGPQSLLAPYLGRSAAIFKCPSDRFLSSAQQRLAGRSGSGPTR